IFFILFFWQILECAYKLARYIKKILSLHITNGKGRKGGLFYIYLLNFRLFSTECHLALLCYILHFVTRYVVECIFWNEDVQHKIGLFSFMHTDQSGIDR
ncbi:hypothetical protein ACJX0J_031481, partial [Zea mays]